MTTGKVSFKGMFRFRKIIDESAVVHIGIKKEADLAASLFFSGKEISWWKKRWAPESA
jgi:hypothetical protein